MSFVSTSGPVRVCVDDKDDGDDEFDLGLTITTSNMTEMH